LRKIRLPGWSTGPVYFSHRLKSTSDCLREMAGQGAAHGTVVWAKEQTRGRGRRGREWFSPPGGLYFSVLFKTGPLLEPSFALIAGGAVIGGVKKRVKLNLKIKWPNDIMRNGNKVGGILCEKQGELLIVGVGLNLEIPANLKNSFSPGSLPELKSHPPGEIMGLILNKLEEDLEVFQENGFLPFRNEQRRLSFLLGRWVTVDNLQGQVIDYGEKGQLIIRCADGTEKHCWQGTVMVLEEE